MKKHSYEKLAALARVMDTLEILRRECPWDRVQTNQSLRPNTIEEVYELSEALLQDDVPNIRKELGDVLLHVLFYALIGEEQGAFDIADVAASLNEKLIFRHPHVFGTRHVEGAEEVMQNWEELKLREKGGNRTVLQGVPSGLPSLVKAFRVQEKAAHVGFDWEEPSQVWEKVQEEIGEFAAEAAAGDTARMEQEMGDVLFSLVNVCRLHGINPDTALERTNAKFIRRFNYLEAHAPKPLKEMSLDEMEALWQEAKAQE